MDPPQGQACTAPYSSSQSWGSSKPHPQGYPMTSKFVTDPCHIYFRSILRLFQFLLSLIAFSTMLATKQAFTFNTGMTKYSAVITFSDYESCSFLVAVMVMLFMWSLVTGFLDLVEMRTGKYPFQLWRPYATLLLDMVLVFLSFGAACCVAGLTRTPGLFCEASYTGDFCNHAKAASVAGFLAFFALFPSFYMSILAVFQL